MTTEALTMSQDDLFHRLRAAYLRGAKWTNDNVLYTPADVEKAAYDYADAVVSPLTPTVEKVETPAQGTPAPQTHVVGDAPILFGLEAQGHIPAVEAALAEGADWQEIGRRIGWDGETAKTYYERHLARLATKEGQQ